MMETNNAVDYNSMSKEALIRLLNDAVAKLEKGMEHIGKLEQKEDENLTVKYQGLMSDYQYLVKDTKWLLKEQARYYK